MTYEQALAAMPEGFEWSSSFGYPGEGGYTEFWRNAAGTRWTVSNGTWMAFAPFSWVASELAPMPASV